MRWVALGLSAAAMAGGVLIMTGYLVPRRPGFSDEVGVAFGVVIFLYGMYRFAITYYRRPRS
jgi:prolipoprotein diacylglyceryltransferase